jgi:hypothetical protein
MMVMIVVPCSHTGGLNSLDDIQGYPSDTDGKRRLKVRWLGLAVFYLRRHVKHSEESNNGGGWRVLQDMAEIVKIVEIVKNSKNSKE